MNNSFVVYNEILGELTIFRGAAGNSIVGGYDYSQSPSFVGLLESGL